ncbi:CoA pyrophosphatase [Pelagerythrobacter marensis]|uniref:NUDIX hydrolase n=1 Tax=Pelagerythrobacter marensis TaxID=543877 RepID=A0A0G3XA44_9SPHN|nr:CoA pyrophosphatase [Pelagerythrobacter marensis]AKM07233.1 NUDIX hydrolase [Pelagerythrobacter marensis]
MSALFDRLQTLFEQGHRAEIPDLLSDERFADADRTADAAVLIAVTDRPAPGVILTQRPAGMRNHPGQVAFPGGKIDPGENAIQAALREAEEELAMQRAQVRIVGATDRYQTGTGFDITPVLGVVPPDLPLVPNPGEVEAWFEAPLDIMLDRDNWTEHEVFWNGATRRYLEYHHEGFRIWGVTAAIIANLSRRIEYRALFDA